VKKAVFTEHFIKKRKGEVLSKYRCNKVFYPFNNYGRYSYNYCNNCDAYGYCFLSSAHSLMPLWTGINEAKLS